MSASGTSGPAAGYAAEHRAILLLAMVVFGAPTARK